MKVLPFNSNVNCINHKLVRAKYMLENGDYVCSACASKTKEYQNNLKTKVFKDPFDLAKESCR